MLCMANITTISYKYKYDRENSSQEKTDSNDPSSKNLTAETKSTIRNVAERPATSGPKRLERKKLDQHRKPNENLTMAILQLKQRTSSSPPEKERTANNIQNVKQHRKQTSHRSKSVSRAEPVNASSIFSYDFLEGKKYNTSLPDLRYSSDEN
uniref:Uncharacterized protein n=1 Tax=Glossina pallidipes TaxID=7398 RepID=A0A1A9ZXH7_GLOPL